MIEFDRTDLTAPDGCIVGVIATGNSELRAPAALRFGPADALPANPGNYIFDHPFSTSDSFTRFRGISKLVALRRAGATVVLISHDEPLIEHCADEIWWIREGELMARGDPSEVLPLYRNHVAQALRAAGSEAQRLTASMRSGNGRGTLESIERDPSTIWLSGEAVAIQVTVRYAAEVANPVIGILIRTRIGLNVYGTNTELENVDVGPVQAGDTVRVTYRFRCNLCPGDYTITAASHDPDGTWHDWQEDAVAFAVADSRYTAGVANLRAVVTVDRPVRNS